MVGAPRDEWTDPDRHDQRSLPQVELLVQRLARESCPAGQCPIEPVLARCAHEAVAELWQTSRITGYMPLLALKAVQDCIRAGTCDRAARP